MPVDFGRHTRFEEHAEEAADAEADAAQHAHAHAHDELMTACVLVMERAITQRSSASAAQHRAAAEGAEVCLKRLLLIPSAPRP